MNKNEIYKSIGVIESAIMCAKETIGFVNTDYVMEHLTAVQDWVDKSCIDEKHTTPVYTCHEINSMKELVDKLGNLPNPELKPTSTFSNGCKVNAGLHVYYNGKCDYCGKVKDDNQ